MAGLALTTNGAVYAASDSVQTFPWERPFNSLHVRTEVALRVAVDANPTSTSFMMGANSTIIFHVNENEDLRFVAATPGETGEVRVTGLASTSDGGESFFGGGGGGGEVTGQVVIAGEDAEQPASASNPLSVRLASVDGAVTINVDEADLAALGAVGDAAWSGTGNGTLIAVSKAEYAKLEAVRALLAGATPAGENHIGSVGGYGFDVVATPTVTSGAYSAGDVVGGYMEFTVARANDEPVVITGVQVVFKGAVQPNLRAIFFSAAPSALLSDNDAYSLSAANALLVRRSLSTQILGSAYTSHGTPKSVSLTPQPFVMAPYAGDKKVGVYIIDDSGVTLTSTSDMQVRITGLGI